MSIDTRKIMGDINCPARHENAVCFARYAKQNASHTVSRTILIGITFGELKSYISADTENKTEELLNRIPLNGNDLILNIINVLPYGFYLQLL